MFNLVNDELNLLGTFFSDSIIICVGALKTGIIIISCNFYDSVKLKAK